MTRDSALENIGDAAAWHQERQAGEDKDRSRATIAGSGAGAIKAALTRGKHKPHAIAGNLAATNGASFS